MFTKSLAKWHKLTSNLKKSDVVIFPWSRFVFYGDFMVIFEQVHNHQLPQWEDQAVGDRPKQRRAKQNYW